MKTLLLCLTFMILAGQLSFSQEKQHNKNKNQIGVFAIPWDGHKYYYLDVYLRYFRFVTNKINTGAGINLFNASELGLYSVEFEPFVRYYFLQRKISPVVELNYNMNINIPNDYYPNLKTRMHSLNLEAGIAMTGMLWDRIGAEVLIGYGYGYYVDHDRVNNNDMQLSFLVTYKFPK